MNQTPQEKTFSSHQIPLSKLAIISGLSLLVMVLTVPFAEFYIFPKLVNPEDASETANNILNNKLLFSSGIFLNFITIICDIVAAWGLYLFLKPISKSLSLLTAWFRLIYTAVYLVALMNLVKIFALLKTGGNIIANSQDQVHDFVLFYFEAFKFEWFFGLIIFGLYLILLGYLTMKSTYIPKIMGWFLIIAGLGYIFAHLGKFMYPNVDTSFTMITAMGELVFMFWLLIKGSRLKAPPTIT